MWIILASALQYICCRSQDKAEAAAEEVARAGGNRCHVHAYAADLSSLDQTKDLAHHVQRDHPDFDILLNNAGAAFPSIFYKPLYCRCKLAGYFSAHHLSPFPCCTGTTLCCIAYT
jgi:NAD(P)-dependent dehydrogenase (short-subunit alcohol dehydrogenase family)